VSACVRYGNDELTVTVANSPGDRPARRAGAAGYGLTGLRERVAMLRGSFTAGPDGDGGFVVSAALPAPPRAGAETGL
jgi:signal transduction histidine kinase